jgi:hypothetical protein
MSEHMTDIVDRLHVILDKYQRRYKRVGWQPVVRDAISEIRRLRKLLNAVADYSPAGIPASRDSKGQERHG